MPSAITAPAAEPPSQSDRAIRLLAAIRVALVVALTALVLAIAALAYVVSFEAIRAWEAPSPKSWPCGTPSWSAAWCSRAPTPARMLSGAPS